VAKANGTSSAQSPGSAELSTINQVTHLSAFAKADFSTERSNTTAAVEVNSVTFLGEPIIHWELC
jgi:hypothetical protein